MFLNDDNVHIEKPDRVISPTFVADDFSGLFLHPSSVFMKHSRST